VDDPGHRPMIDDMVRCGEIFEKVGLYPTGKKLDTLSWRNDYYRWIGKLHLDHRNGMSYGFLAWQMPLRVPKLFPIEEAKKRWGNLVLDDKDHFVVDGKVHVILEVAGERLTMPIPDVWVLSQRSGSHKTRFDPSKDLVKMGLINGVMHLETPHGVKLSPDYKPSFDTRVMLAHSVGNAIVAALLRHMWPDSDFARRMEEVGIAMSHWHGYLNPAYVPDGWFVHGIENPHVSCSSPQSAIYALDGKLQAFQKSLEDAREFKGDIHIEPHHGTNICYTTLTDFAQYVSAGDHVVRLGNSFFNEYGSTTHGDPR
jgi:hypothetical protein